MRHPAIPCVWRDGAFHPIGSHLAAAAQAFSEGQKVPLIPMEERSGPSHRHLFATIREAWINLPEGLEERFPSPDHLRKFALVKGGFFDERSIVCSSPSEARKIGAFLQPRDEFAVITVTHNVVTEYTAQSMAEAAMDARTFQRAKETILAILADMLGVEVGSLPTAEAA